MHYLEKLATDGMARQHLVRGLCWFMAGYMTAFAVAMTTLLYYR